MTHEPARIENNHGARWLTKLFYLGLACLLTHELDAVTHSEWRLLFGLRNMADDSASSVFVSLHVPLIFFVLWVSHHRRPSLRNVARVSVSAFLVVHAALHFALSSTPEYEFDGALSNTLILSAGVCGIAFLLLNWRVRRSGPV